MASTEAKIPVKLNKQSDWVDWDRQFRNLAKRMEVWDYIDPDSTLELEIPTIPRILRGNVGESRSDDTHRDEEDLYEVAGGASQRRPATTRSKTTSGTPQPQSEAPELDLKLQIMIYQIQQGHYNDLKKKLNAVSDAFHQSIGKEFLEWIQDEVKLRDQYKSLIDNVKTYQREITRHLAKEMDKALAELKVSEVNQWCHRIEALWKKCSENKVTKYIDPEETAGLVLEAIATKFSEIADAIAVKHSDSDIDPRLVLREFKQALARKNIARANKAILDLPAVAGVPPTIRVHRTTSPGVCPDGLD